MPCGIANKSVKEEVYRKSKARQGGGDRLHKTRKGMGNLNKQLRLTCLVIFAVSIVAGLSLVASSSAAPPPGDQQFSVIADASNSYLNTTPGGIVPGTNYMDTPTLMALLDDNGDGAIGPGDDPTNDPLVIDVRAQNAYEGTAGGMGLGHIPGAIHITTYSYKDIVKPANLLYIRQQLAKHQKKEIVLACYSGHTDKLAEMALGAVAQAGYFGFPAPQITALKWGNLGWNSAGETSVLAEVTPGSSDIYVHTYGVEATPHALLPVPNPYPVINNTTSTEPAEITRVAGDLSEYATNPPFIWPGTGAGQVNDANIGNYTVLDVRTAAEYAAGHITGAVNIPYQQLFAKDMGGDYTNLLSIDTSKPVIVYANGQQESNAAVIGLNALGIRNAGAPDKGLRYGLAAWNYNYGMMFLAPEEHSYPIVTGSAPGGLTYSGSCSGGKPSLSLGAPHAYWASLSDYNAGLLSVDWTNSNIGASIAYDIDITGSTNNNGVTLSTTLPLTVANIMSPGGSATATLKYNIPVGVTWFHTTMTGSTTDVCGNSYTLP